MDIQIVYLLRVLHNCPSIRTISQQKLDFNECQLNCGSINVLSNKAESEKSQCLFWVYFSYWPLLFNQQLYDCGLVVYVKWICMCYKVHL